MTELNQVIARKDFCTLVMDYDIEGFCSCRVLTDGWFSSFLTTDCKETAIERFLKGEWRE